MTVFQVVALVMGLISAAEIVLRLVASSLPDPVHWHDEATQCKEAQVDALRRRGGVDVVYVGTSMMLFSVDPVVVDAITGLRSYNASIFRAVPTVSALWLQDVVLPRLRPKLVVVGLSAFDVNDNGLLATRYQEYLEAPRFRYGRVRRGLVVLGRHSYVCRYVFLVRKPRTVLSSFARGIRRPRRAARGLPVLPGLLGPLGQGLEFEDREFARMVRMTELIRQQVVQDWENRGEQTAALRRIFDDVTSYGGEALFLEMPVTDEFRDFFIGGETHWQQVRGQLVRTVSSWGAQVMTLGEHSDLAYFADMIHMNGRGREAFSEALGRALIDEGVVRRLADAGVHEQS